MNVSTLAFAVCCVGSGLCDGLIPRPGGSYRVCVFICLIVCNLGTSTMGQPRPELGCCGTDSKVQNCSFVQLSIKLCRRLTLANLAPEVKASGSVYSVFQFTFSLDLTSGSVVYTDV